MAINPNYDDALTNLGNILQRQEKLIEAEQAYGKAIAIRSNNAEAHFGMGNTLLMLGSLAEAMGSYCKALSVRPTYSEAYFQATELLKVQKIEHARGCNLLDLEKEVESHSSKILSTSSNGEIELILKHILDCISKANIKFKTPISQIYKRNSRNMDCGRHLKIFNEKSIIPKFCFGCFKVQVEVDDLFSLIKLTKLFYDFRFETDLTRKTMIEMRPSISGFYKGLFYCSGLDQAYKLK